MKNDITPPQQPGQELPPIQLAPQQVSSDATSPSAELSSNVQKEEPAKNSPKKKRRWIVTTLAGLVLLLILTVFAWYALAQRPVSPEDTARTRIRVVAGSTSSEVGQLLRDNNLIRSELAFQIYSRLTGTNSRFQAGAYSISPSEPLSDVVKHLISGQADQFTLTFYPGATLRDIASMPENSKTDVETVLLRAGYDEAEIEAAFNQTYDHPLFSDKPQTADLEGYVYGETYNFDSSATVEQILVRTFDEFYAKVQEENLIEGFKKQGLTLYEGITMASIVQREVPLPNDQKQVAQVFLKRYREGIELGSDITAYYGSDKYGLPRAVSVDTPYNTRINEGLPPGPIATPGLTALQAVASPARGDYLYFLSGDDEVTYFARTNEEHEANIRNHCQVKCAID